MKKISLLLLILLAFAFTGCLSIPNNEKKAPRETIVITVINQCNWELKLSFFLEGNSRDYTGVYHLGREPQTVELVKDADYELGILGAYDIHASTYGIHIGEKDILIFDWDSYENRYKCYSRKSEDLQN